MPAAKGSDYLLAAEQRPAGQLQLQFHWDTDRFTQLLSLVRPHATVLLLASIDRDDRPEWPPSPPLQQLLVEDRPDGPVALLVGMAGSSHWSASVERLSDPAGLRFDVACRARQSPTRLASSYLSELPLESTADDSVALQIPAARVVVRALPVEGHAARIEMHAGSRPGLSVRPQTSGEPPLTVRWRYEVRMM